MFERFTLWHLGILFALPAVATAKTESNSLCRWLDNKLQIFTSTTATNAREATYVHKEDAIHWSVARMSRGVVC